MQSPSDYTASDKTSFVFEFSLSLSRACLGKYSVSSINWRQQDVLSPAFPPAGAIATAGFDKDDTHYYYSWWKNDTKHLHILPSDWNAPVPVGSPINMAVFSAAASVELKVNGVSLGKQAVPHGGVVHYDQTTSGEAILFKPGKLEATSCVVVAALLAMKTTIAA